MNDASTGGGWFTDFTSAITGAATAAGTVYGTVKNIKNPPTAAPTAAVGQATGSAGMGKQTKWLIGGAVALVVILVGLIAFRKL